MSFCSKIGIEAHNPPVHNDRVAPVQFEILYGV